MVGVSRLARPWGSWRSGAAQPHRWDGKTAQVKQWYKYDGNASFKIVEDASFPRKTARHYNLVPISIMKVSVSAVLGVAAVVHAASNCGNGNNNCQRGKQAQDTSAGADTVELMPRLGHM